MRQNCSIVSVAGNFCLARELGQLTRGSTDNDGNEVNLVSGIIRLPSGLDFSVCMGD